MDKKAKYKKLYLRCTFTDAEMTDLAGTMADQHKQENNVEKVTKAEMVQKVAMMAGVPQTVSKAVIESLAKYIDECKNAGYAVPFCGLGKFVTKDRPAKSGYSMLTGRQWNLPARRVLTFKASK